MAPVRPPVAPMLARLTRVLPVGGDWRYEPKWDGFRCLAFVDSAGTVDLRSRNDRPLARYFPEVVQALGAGGAVVFDGELLACGPDGADFELLLARLHPAASRVERLRRESPARYVVFDVLSTADHDLRDAPFDERRRALEQMRSLDAPSGVVLRTPLTADPDVAAAWLATQTSEIDGVVAKHAAEPYRAGKRTMVKVKPERRAEVIVGGFRPLLDPPGVASLLLGLHDDDGMLQHVGVCASFTAARRRQLLDEITPYVAPLGGHPWEHGFVTGGGRLGRLPGAAGRWMPGEPRDWIPLRPHLVCEVSYDKWESDRFRHAARFVRWRPDRDPPSCTFDQMTSAP